MGDIPSEYLIGAVSGLVGAIGILWKSLQSAYRTRIESLELQLKQRDEDVRALRNDYAASGRLWWKAFEKLSRRSSGPPRPPGQT